MAEVGDLGRARLQPPSVTAGLSGLTEAGCRK